MSRNLVYCATIVSFASVCLAASISAQEALTQKPEVAESRTADSVVIKPEVTPKKEKPESSAKDPKPEWIWAGGKKAVRFEKTFNASSKSAELIVTCDNTFKLSINGKQVASSTAWESPVKVNVQKFLVSGENKIVVDATNEGGIAGFVCKLKLNDEQGRTDFLLSDKSWKATDPKHGSELKISTHGKMGVGPWNDVFSGATGKPQQGSRQSAAFNLLPGFQVELIYTVPKGELGSWVSICPDGKGGLFVSDQGGKGLCRVTPAKIGDPNAETRVEPLDLKITSAQGLLYAFDALYLSVNGGPGSGFYRATDTDGDDKLDKVELLKKFRGGGEHGPHALRLSPDGKSIYVIGGNHVDLPEGFQASRVPTNWSEDHLLPRQWDARGHAKGRLAPGGWIGKTDPEGKQWEIISTGYRNPYSMDFNADGEIFAYDADMEWDMGTPWYRPTRVVHATSGSEFGWRSGTGKWPSYYADSLPEVVDIGPGSPVGAHFGYGAKFPAKYQKAFYICDWTFGTMYAIHIRPEGAAYRATKEDFVSRTPLPLTDVTINTDGAMYFTIGGRGANSSLYRVTYVGKDSTSPVNASDTEGEKLRSLRRQLEVFHLKKDAASVDFAWPYLSHEDRHIRFAARIALENQDVKTWQERALKETNPQALITAMVGLARQGDKSLANRATEVLGGIKFGDLSEPQRLEYLRACSLVFIRLGKPDQSTATGFAKQLDPFFPAESGNMNRELSRVLVYLNSPTVIDKTLAIMKRPSEQTNEDITELLSRNRGYGRAIQKMLENSPELQNIHYAYCLRNMRFGWTLSQRREYFQWLNDALSRSGGASYQGFIKNIRTEAMANLSEAEKLALDAKTIAPPLKVTELPKPKGPGAMLKAPELLALLQSKLHSRDFENGKRSFAAAECVVCHRFDGAGGATGPDLTNVAGRFGHKELVEAVMDPSKIISDQYQAHDVVTVDGKTYSGRIESEDDKKVVLLTDAVDPLKSVEIKQEDIEEMEPSRISQMPADLLSSLNENEVLDLIAYMLSRGNAEDQLFGNN